MHILAFESFDSGSHQAVRRSIERHSRHDWRWVTRPGRAWKWRMRIGALELVDTARREGALAGAVDVVLVTSLSSASDLRAALPPDLRTRPLAVYMHENQAAYPPGHTTEFSAERDVHFALTNLSSVLTADLVIWNSVFNRDSFVDGIGRLLRHAPDTTLREADERILARSIVIWPPVGPAPPTAPRRVLHKPVRVVWPHRWEHDKGPDELLELALRHSEPLDLRWTILGERYPRVPLALDEFQRRLAHRIDHFGYEPDRAAYWRHLRASDWVLSTARHEFFGIAVVEALLAGCLPWLPPRLSYPELLPPLAQGLSPVEAPEDAAPIRAAILAHLQPAVAPHAVARLDDVLEQM